MSTLIRRPPGAGRGGATASGGPPRRSRGRTPDVRSVSRLGAVLALAVVAAVLVYLFTRSDSDHYRLDFADAGQLVIGDLVRIGGTQAGTVQRIALTDAGQAQVTISLDRSFGPLHQGTTAAIRNPGLTDVASRYLDLSPGPANRPTLPGDAVIPEVDTSGIVDIDEVLNTFNSPTREGLRRVIRGFGAWYQGRGPQANASAHYLPVALSDYARLFDEVDSSTPGLERFISQTDLALGEIDRNAPALTDLIGHADTTVNALASDNASLSAGLAQLPAALRTGAVSLQSLRQRTLPALGRLSDAVAPTIAPLRAVLPRLDPVLDEAVPTFALLRQLIARPGPDNDLYDALTVLPRVAGDVRGDFPRAIEALHKATPIFSYARPYFPDLVAWLDNWDGIFAPYDADGHYARTLPVFDAYTLADAGHELTPTPPDARGLAGLSTHFMARCPGSAAAVGDGSSPYVDRGSLANPHCDPAQAAGSGQ